jgi:RNA polymerase-associated protein CTR9
LFQAPEQDGKGRAKDPLAERFYLDPTGSRVQQVATDPDLYVEIARLWTGEESSKSLSAYRQSLQVRLDKLGPDEGDDAEVNGESVDLANNEDDGVVRYPRDFPPQLLCNIGALEFTRKEYVSAYNRFEHAMKLDAQRQQDAAAKGTSTAEGDAVLMTVTYNLGIVMEERRMIHEAIELYEQRLLTRHPEFLEGKLSHTDRCAQLLMYSAMRSQSSLSTFSP